MTTHVDDLGRGLQPSGVRPRRKQYLDGNVYELALERMRYAYTLFDEIVVSFSGGKDSTAALNVTIEVARELGRLPVKAVFLDEECIPWETVEYVQRTAERPEVELYWYCLPFALRNAWSRRHPEWWTWAPESADRWARPLPDFPGIRLITECAGVTDVEPEKRPSFVCDQWRLYPVEWGNIGMVLGIRAQESISRHRSVTWRTENNYITPLPTTRDEERGWSPYGNRTKVQPIYDWSSRDVWTAPALLGWDYNRAYDVYEAHGVPIDAQRCSPAFGEEPIGTLHQFATCFPDVWERMCYRVPGVLAASRYARTELYGYGDVPPKPVDMTWHQYLQFWIAKHPPDVQTHINFLMRKWIRAHFYRTNDPILVRTGHPESGISWNFLLRIAMRGDLKQRKTPNHDPSRQARYDAELRELIAAGRLQEATKL